MDEFVKRLYDFMGIYKKIWSQNSHYRYLPIFFQKFLHKCARAPQSQFFDGKIGSFLFFGEKSTILPIFPRFFFCFFFSMPTENRFLNDISAEKNEFLFPADA